MCNYYCYVILILKYLKSLKQDQSEKQHEALWDIKWVFFCCCCLIFFTLTQDTTYGNQNKSSYLRVLFLVK